jgi:NADH-quinone oxidoreductase subunit G
LQARGLQAKLSPFDPIAILDEIQRLVPGYDISRLSLLAGNDQHTTTEEAVAANVSSHPENITPAGDTLFTSGTLGRYSNTLNSVLEHEREEPADKQVAV